MKSSIAQIFKSKDRMEVEQYLEQLPQITLSTPVIRKDKLRKVPNSPPIDQWKNHRGPSHELLTELINFLVEINRQDVALDTRGKMADDIRRVASRVINTNYNSFIVDDTFPVPEESRKTLAAMIEFLEQLNVTYKHLFRAALKKVRNHKFNHLSLLRESGFRIIEIIYTLQRVQALSYKALPIAFWGELNQVYYTLLMFYGVSTPRELTGYVKLRKRAGKDEVVYTGDQPKSATQIYLAVQMFGLSDAYSWPAPYLHMNDAYISLCQSTSMITSHIDPNRKNGQIPVYFDQGKAPSLMHHTKQNKPGVLIDVLPILRMVSADLNHMITGSNKSSPAIATLDSMDRLTFIQNYYKKLCPLERTDNRVRVIDQSRTLSVYLGFEESHKAICNLDPERYRSYMKKKEFTELLAANSAMIAEDDESVNSGRWFVMDESEGGLKIRTRETKFTNNVSLGQIIAFQEMNKDVKTSEQLGYVCRMQRMENHDLEIAIVRISSHAEGVLVRQTDAGTNQAPILAFLAKDSEENRMLILHCDTSISSNEVLSMERGTDFENVRVGDVVTMQREFVCYQLFKVR